LLNPGQNGDLAIPFEQKLDLLSLVFGNYRQAILLGGTSCHARNPAGVGPSLLVKFQFGYELKDGK
jgi:hypothetical protein